MSAAKYTFGRVFVIAYLVLAAIRLVVSPVKPEYRPRLFFLRLMVAPFALALAVPALMIMNQYHGDEQFGAIMAEMLVIFVGEHLIFLNLWRRQMLPANVHRLPLAY